MSFHAQINELSLVFLVLTIFSLTERTVLHIVIHRSVRTLPLHHRALGVVEDCSECLGRPSLNTLGVSFVGGLVVTNVRPHRGGVLGFFEDYVGCEIGDGNWKLNSQNTYADIIRASSFLCTLTQFASSLSRPRSSFSAPSMLDLRNERVVSFK